MVLDESVWRHCSGRFGFFGVPGLFSQFQQPCCLWFRFFGFFGNLCPVLFRAFGQNLFGSWFQIDFLLRIRNSVFSCMFLERGNAEFRDARSPRCLPMDTISTAIRSLEIEWCPHSDRYQIIID